MTGRGVLIQGLTAADMRDAVENWFFRPVARYLFHVEPKLQGLALGVTEYYNDNWDQVYLRLLPTCDPRPRWPESFTAEHTHAEQPLGLSARQQELLVEGALQALFGVKTCSLTDCSQERWRFAFEAVIREGAYGDLPWAELYLPYWTAVRKGAGEAEFHKAGGLARDYAENRLSLLIGKSGTSLVPADAAPPVLVVPPLAQEDWVFALEALNHVASWESCLLELFRSASMLVAFVRAAHPHGPLSEAELRQREETVLLQESLQHLSALFSYVGLLAPERGAEQVAWHSEPGPLRLYGSSPAQLRDWFSAMYFAPLARLVLRSKPEAKVLTLHLYETGLPQGGEIYERVVLGGSEPVDVTADWNQARQTLYGLSRSVVHRNSLQLALGDLRKYADRPLLQFHPESGEARWLCTQPGTVDHFPTRSRQRPSQASRRECQSPRVAEILSILDRCDHFAAPLNACLTPCAAYLAHPSPERVWEIAAALSDLQFLLEVLGVDLSRLQ